MAAFLYWYAIKRLFKNTSVMTRCNIFLIFVVFTNGNIVSFDRGSVHFFVFALVLVSYLKYREGKISQSLVLYVLAVGLKPQVAFCLILLIFLKKYHQFILTIVLLLISNLFALLFFSGGYAKSLQGYLTATLTYTGSPATYPQIASSDSIIGIITRYRELFKDSSTTIPFLTHYRSFLIVPGLIWLGVITLVLFLQWTSFQVCILLSLSTVTFIVPASNSYTLGWFSVGILLLVANSQEKLTDKSSEMGSCSKTEKFLIRAIYFVGITPFFDLLIPFKFLQKVQPLLFFLPPLYFLLITNSVRLHFQKKKLDSLPVKIFSR
jgi:hypothetical protein